MTEAQKEKVLYHLLKAEAITRRMMDPEYGLESETTSSLFEIVALLLLVGFAGWLIIVHGSLPRF